MKAFFAYPSSLPDIVQAIHGAKAILSTDHPRVFAEHILPFRRGSKTIVGRRGKSKVSLQKRAQ
jgi:hypothetical protein